MRVARRYLINGRVQGVGFRYFTEAAASREGVAGWVRNLPDRRVEIGLEVGGRLVRMWWIDYGIYDKTTVDKDLKRIERFYRARGYYDAHVRAGRVLKNGDRAVKVQVVVEEGQPVMVDALKTVGLEKLLD